MDNPSRWRQNTLSQTAYEVILTTSSWSPGYGQTLRKWLEAGCISPLSRWNLGTRELFKRSTACKCRVWWRVTTRDIQHSSLVPFP
jgi:hypothetical protein